MENLSLGKVVCTNVKASRESCPLLTAQICIYGACRDAGWMAELPV